jgi:thioredoxin-like negative regulator of GroEL
VNEIYTRAEQKLTEKDLSGAAALFGAILNEHRLKCESIGLAGLALVGVAEGKVQEAKEIIDSIKVRSSAHSWHIKSNVVQQRYPADIKFPAVSKAISQVELAMQAAGAKVRQNELF